MSTSSLQLFLTHALPILARTSGVVGVAVGGSWIEQTLDAYSDLDLVIVLDPAHAERLMGERPQVAASLGNLLECFTGEHVGEPRLLICLYDEPLLHVDLKFVSLPDLAHRVEDPQVLWQQDTLVSEVLRASSAQWPPAPSLEWLEDRFWIWTHYASTKLGRGELLEVVSFLDFLRTTVLGPLLAQQYGAPARGVRKLEQLLPATALTALQATIGAPNRADCLAALRQAVALYQHLRAALRSADFEPKARVEARALAYLAEIAAG